MLPNRICLDCYDKSLELKAAGHGKRVTTYARRILNNTKYQKNILKFAIWFNNNLYYSTSTSNFVE